MSSAKSKLNDKVPEQQSHHRGSSQRPIANVENHYNSNVMNIPETKWIQTFINGDEHFNGFRCVVNNRYYRSFETFLNYLTERLQPSFGAVRNIYTPINGHSIRSLDELISKQKYVVAGNERFKKLECGYNDVSEKKLSRSFIKTKSKFKPSKSKPVHLRSLSVYLFRNGSLKGKPSRVYFNTQDLDSWDSFYKKICEVLKCSPLKRIYSIIGKPVKTIDELVNNQSYVIVGKHEVFKKGSYETNFSTTNSALEKKYHYSSRSRKSSSVISKSSGLFSCSSAQSLKFRFTESPNISEKLRSSAKYNNKDDFLNLHENKFLEKSEIYKPNNSEIDSNFLRKIIDLDDDISGIYRSRMQNDLTIGATEIEDSPETVIDLPIDLMESEEIEEDITPDMERSLQHLSLDVPDEIVAFLPSMQQKQSREQSANKCTLSQSQTIDAHNIFV